MEEGRASNSSAEIQTTDIPPPNTKEVQINDSVVIEIPEFNNWSTCVIFRVPKKLRDSKIKAYTPHLVSIGPFHHGTEELKGMESHKENYHFKEFCKRTCKSEEDLLSFIRKNSAEILTSYAGSIHLDRNVFERMILIDASFIFELFSRFSETNSDQNDYILRTAWLRNEIKLDLIKLENQIPFSFLEKLYNFSNPRLDNYKLIARNNKGHTEDEDEEHQPSTIFLNLTLKFFSPGMFGTTNKKIKHFTDMFRRVMLPTPERKLKSVQQPTKSKVNHLCTATKLDKAGVHFAKATARKGSTPPNLTDVQVSERRPWCKFIPCLRSIQLELSPFTIQDSTECIMRNIMALEQCHYPDKAVICNYICLMSELIDTKEDVDFLVGKKIIKNLLGSNEEAADLVNQLCLNIAEVNFIYSDQCNQLNVFYEKWYNVAKATLKRVYFKDLWTASSTVVGIFVLIFSISSTIKSLFFS